VGKPVFVNHDNDDIMKARGVIIDAALHDDITPDGARDVWVEVLMEVDAMSYPKLAQSILRGDIERTSMGVDCEWSRCSVCDNVAFTEYDFCSHIPDQKGMTYQRDTGEMVLVREVVGGLTFFENSLLVEDPADPTAHFLAVDDRGVGVGSYRGGLTRGAKRVRANAPDPFAAAAEAISAAGGTTVSTHGKSAPSSGYMVSLPDLEAVYPQDQVTEETLRGYADVYRDELADENRFLGGWVSDGNVYLDVSEHVPDGDEAFRLGHEREQKAVWDFDSDMDWPLDAGEYTRAASVKVARPVLPSSVPRFFIEIDPDDYDAAELVAFIHSVCSGTKVAKMGMRRRAFGERVAPANISTLERDSACPVCGEEGAAWDGATCSVCGYIEPPSIFQDPDLEAAGDLDALREADEKMENAEDTETDTEVPDTEVPGTETEAPDGEGVPAEEAVPEPEDEALFEAEEDGAEEAEVEDVEAEEDEDTEATGEESPDEEEEEDDEALFE
jgi:hypothetical protein